MYNYRFRTGNYKYGSGSYMGIISFGLAAIGIISFGVAYNPWHIHHIPIGIISFDLAHVGIINLGLAIISMGLAAMGIISIELAAIGIISLTLAVNTPIHIPCRNYKFGSGSYMGIISMGLAAIWEL